MSLNTPKIIDRSVEDKIAGELTKTYESKRKRVFSKLIGAALGSVPWVGGYLSALHNFRTGEKQVKNNQMKN